VRRIIASEGVTLDGYFSDPDGGIAWQSLDDDFNAYSIELLDEVDTLILGRTTYEELGAFWPTASGAQYDSDIARRMNAHAKIVVSRGSLDLSWENSRQLTGDLVGAIHELKAGPGKDIALLGSGSILAQLTDAGMIDEYRLQMNPVILADGKSLFAGVQKRCDLTLAETRQFGSGGVLLRYRRRSPG
jgi:dihydrofolate reductase